MTVRIGVVGAGFIARYHAMHLRLIVVRGLTTVAARTPAPGPRLSPDVRDVWRAHELVDAIYRSAAAGGAPGATGRRS